MSLTKEDLQAISDLIDIKLKAQMQEIDKRFDEQDKKFNARFDEQDNKFDGKLDKLKEDFKEMLLDNNLLITEHVQRVVSESEERLTKEINEIRAVTAENCYDVALLRHKVS